MKPKFIVSGKLRIYATIPLLLSICAAFILCGKLSAQPDAASPNAIYIAGRFNGNFSIVQFRVSGDGKFRPLNPPAISMQDEPCAIAADPQGQNVYLPQRNCIVHFKIRADGSLKKEDVVVCVPLIKPVEKEEDVTSIHFSPSGLYAYAMVAPMGNLLLLPGKIIVYRREPSGKLTEIRSSRMTGLTDPVTMAWSPDGKFAYILYSGQTIDEGSTLALYSVQPNGRLKPSSPLTLMWYSRFYDGCETIVSDRRDSKGYLYTSNLDHLVKYQIQPDGTLKQIFAYSIVSGSVIHCNNVIYALSKIFDHGPAPTNMLRTLQDLDDNHLVDTTFKISKGGLLQMLQNSDDTDNDDTDNSVAAISIMSSPDASKLFILNEGVPSSVYCYALGGENGILRLLHAQTLPVNKKGIDELDCMTVVNLSK